MIYSTHRARDITDRSITEIESCCHFERCRSGMILNESGVKRDSVTVCVR